MKKMFSAFAVVTIASGALFTSWAAEQVHLENNQVKAYESVAIHRAVAMTVPEQEGLEKILKPEMIKYYEGVRKIGPSLYGKKRSSKTMENRVVIKNDVKKEVNKVETPKVMMDKKTTDTKRTEKSGEAKPAQKLVKIDPVIAQCVKTAIEKKDTSLKAAFNAQNDAILQALDVRTACQKSAIDQTSMETQQQANKICISAYERSIWNGLEALKVLKEANWGTFRQDMKACSTSQPNSIQQEPIIEDGEMVIKLDIAKDDSADTEVGISEKQ